MQILELKKLRCEGKINSMVISLSPAGVKCQVGDFVMLVDVPAEASAKAGRPPKGNLILKTRVELPIEFPPSPEVIANSGEYEIGGVRVKGVSLGNETNGQILRTVYSVEFEGIKLAFLGELVEEPAGETLGRLGEVDILFLSVSSSKLKAKQTASLIKQIDPKVIIPTDDKTAKLLAEELGQKVKAEEKLVVKKKDLVKEQVANKLVWLKS